MDVKKKELEKALQMATSEHWDNGLQTGSAKLNLVVNSLLAQSRPREPQAELFFSLINSPKNKGIRKILRGREVTTEALAFAIRAAIFQQQRN